ncbi:A disintegrin and metalloproteinase with thrombospondin motifs like isoform X2 [Diachasmimorpha longicaudata]|uniref:A disintegrin and metalloproteinase with thrombospondin motifs like isoform X2 n=1 Tax=Diachasmimorpha longicaudata TaxID=58733 RepID=UPI0030B876B0
MPGNIRRMMTRFIFLCVAVVSQADQIHHHMTKREIQDVFRVSRHAAVPPYEVVPVRHKFSKRSAGDEYELNLKAFNRTMRLRLEPNEGMLYGFGTPVFTVVPDKSQLHGVNYEKVHDAFEGVGKAYRDDRTRSAVVVKERPDQSVQIFGHILNDFVIKPLPRRFRTLVRNRTYYGDTGDRSEQTHHIIFKRLNIINDDIPNEIRLVKDTYGDLNELPTNTSSSRMHTPDVIYPEILIIMDYALFKTQDKDLKKALTYLLAYWNAVDLLYKEISNPRIQLNIAAFIISTKYGGTPFFERNRKDGSMVDADTAIVQMSEQFYHESRFPFSNYDLAVAMTRLDLYTLKTNTPYTEILGYARESGACWVDEINRRMNAVAIIEDNGGFSAILSTAHEIGHLLGAPHDGSETTFACEDRAGYLMSPILSLQENSFHWSECSINKIREFVNSKSAECLYNVPKPGLPLDRELPGELLSLEEQCEKYGSTLCKADADVCASLYCFDPEIQFCLPKAPAAEGSTCGNNKPEVTQ